MIIVRFFRIVRTIKLLLLKTFVERNEIRTKRSGETVFWRCMNSESVTKEEHDLIRHCLYHTLKYIRKCEFYSRRGSIPSASLKFSTLAVSVVYEFQFSRTSCTGGGGQYVYTHRRYVHRCEWSLPERFWSR